MRCTLNMPKEDFSYHISEIDSVLDYLKTTQEGLEQTEASERFLRVGSNELIKEKRESPLILFLSQFKDFVIMILIFASFISILFGQLIDFVAIVIILLLNAFLGFYQEYKAERSLEALQSLTAPHARVLRDKIINVLDAKELVPGDVIFLEAGEIVPADGRLLSAINLHIDESALTGESVPVLKDDGVLLDLNTEISDQTNMIFMGTNVVRGNCIAVICKTGMKTVMGDITNLIAEVDERDTPLKRKMNEFGGQLGWIILGICGIVVLLGVWAQNNFSFNLIYLLNHIKLSVFVEMLIVGVALAVAAVPEGLPAVITVALSIGVIKMSKQRAIVRKLESVETLGSTTVICTDKTGTLTQNKMTVEKILVAPFTEEYHVYNGRLDKNIHLTTELSTLFTVACLCNNATYQGDEEDLQPIGDPTELALLNVSNHSGYIKSEVSKQQKRVFEFPFDSDRKLMSTIHKIQDSKGITYRMYVKGAPDIVENLCESVLVSGSTSTFNSEAKDAITAKEKIFGSEALRILAFAYRDVTQEEIKDISRQKEVDYQKFEKDLTFIGLMAMKDPPRSEAIDAIKTANQAGIRVVMITGDHKNTAVAIGKQMGLLNDNEDNLVLSGRDLRLMSEEQLIEAVKKVKIFARINPEHKLQIVSALQKNNEIVAVTGDGVNDAPALKQADIGVAMGITGTDVAKQASDMVLTDDNFATLELAIEEGRGIYANMKKFISYLLACNTGEVLTIFFGILVLAIVAHGLPFDELLPLTALQLLYINLLTDGLPALALGVDPKEPNVMKQEPRDPQESLFNVHMSSSIILVGIIVGIGSLILYFAYLNLSAPYSVWVHHASNGDVIGGTIIKAQTMCFTGFIFLENVMALSSRSEKDSLFKVGIFSNKYLWGALLLATLIHVCVIYLKPFQEIFKTTALDPIDWVIVLCMSLTVFIAEEIRKYLFRRFSIGQ